MLCLFSDKDLWMARIEKMDDTREINVPTAQSSPRSQRESKTPPSEDPQRLVQAANPTPKSDTKALSSAGNRPSRASDPLSNLSPEINVEVISQKHFNAPSRKLGNCLTHADSISSADSDHFSRRIVERLSSSRALDECIVRRL
jgi:hypothetical protein